MAATYKVVTVNDGDKEREILLETDTKVVRYDVTTLIAKRDALNKLIAEYEKEKSKE